MTSDPIRASINVLGRLRELVITHRGQLSYAAASIEIGIGKATLSDFEKGKLAPGLDVILKLLNWITPPAVALPEQTLLTPAAHQFLSLMQERRGLGQAWLRIEPGYYGLILPDGEGTLGELTYCGRFAKRTVRECSPYFHRGTVGRMPHYRGPKNRDTYDHGHPIDLTDPQPSAQLGITEGDKPPHGD